MNNTINKLSKLDTPNDPDPNKRFRFVSILTLQKMYMIFVENLIMIIII